jgi:hypothetical protein
MFRWMKRSPQAEHEFCQENLSSFLDRQLTPREQARVTRHLQECARCRADLQSLRQTVAVLHAAPAIKPPRTFFIPASEGVHVRQARRNRLAYGYLQFATAVATVLLVLVVSGDALLRLGVATPARQVTAPSVEITAGGKGGEVPEAMPTTAGEAQTAAPAPGAFAAVPPPPVEPTAVTMLAVAPLPAEAGQTETAGAVADNQALTAKALPSQTFARSAGAPPLPASTQEGQVTAAQSGETGVPEPTATLEASPTVPLPTPTATPTPTPVPPTATPLPTETAVAPTATVVPSVQEPSPEPGLVASGRHDLLPPAAAGPLAFLQGLQPLLPWLEWTLGALAAVLLLATLWLRRRQRAL